MESAAKVKVLISSEKVQRRIAQLARQINRDYAGQPLVIVGVLKGAFIFMADLIRHLRQPVTCDFLRVSSYNHGTESSGTVRIEFDITQPIRGKDVLLVEDIVDTGLTLNEAIRHLKAKKPRSLKICALLRKPERERVKIDVDYVGFVIPNKFVVGYGLDYAGQHRNLPYIGYLEE